MHCPLCDRPLKEVLLPGLLASLPGMNARRQRVLSLLIEKDGQPASFDELYLAVWGDLICGGPLAVRGGIYGNIRAIEAIIKPFGWQVPNVHNVGFRLSKLDPSPDFGVIGMSNQDYQELPKSLQHEARLMRSELGSPFLMVGKTPKRVAVAACSKVGAA
ncbi:MAG: hypothetical protein COB78_05875 [Hyphomicrobiales bacterium]|nr:MAG: hypothetical protein COB78_05875 [Hyphomicrobiales bacterium]